MNLELFKLPDPSGVNKKENIVSKKYPLEYEYIIDWCKKYDLDDLLFKYKVYHTINDIKSIPKCYCGKSVKFKNFDEGYNKYCSNKCVNASKDVVNKRKQTNIERFGTDKPQQLLEIKQKVEKTNLERYGHKYGILNPDIKKKAIETLKKNYNVDNPGKSKTITERRIMSFKSNIEQFKQTFTNTCKEKYGKSHFWKVKSIHQKGIDKSTILKRKDSNNLIESRIKEIGYVLNNIDWKFKTITATCSKGHNYTSSIYLFNYRYLSKIECCTVCNIQQQFSGQEDEVYKFIKENYSGKIKRRDRKILGGGELDIYLPELGLAFEFNGLYWHSELNKPNNYHLNKTQICENNGVNLMHIWEDDWLYKREIVESIILNKLGKSKKIYARKCDLQLLTPNQYREFLNNNHLQGSVNAKYKFGLFYNNELVSVMGLGKSRTNTNQKKENRLELYRFCNKIGYTVIGGASKLFKYFITNYSDQFDEIITMADYSRYNSDLYKRLKFEPLHLSGINYWWVINRKRENRYNWAKHVLVKLGYDKDKTEVEIMHSLKHYRIYDCGSLVYLYKK